MEKDQIPNSSPILTDVSVRYFPDFSSVSVRDMSVQVTCPSNIALIKYWGKYPVQLPANPSISYTLQECRSETEIHFEAHQKFKVETFLDGISQDSFSKKIESYFELISPLLPWLKSGSFRIHTHNTFPHSSGIASSASGFGAIAKALIEMSSNLGVQFPNPERAASILARIGSGSASRSLYNGLVVWGAYPPLPESSDEYAVAYPEDKIHPIFRKFNDWVLLVHEGEKSVSSTVGHSLMNNHPYAKERFNQAEKNLKSLTDALHAGDLQEFIKITEHEALSLHAMMMMSDPAFILMKNGTLEIIHAIWAYRKETGKPVFFTLDAGANVHVLFPENEHAEAIKAFISDKLLPHTQKGNLVKDYMEF